MTNKDGFYRQPHIASIVRATASMMAGLLMAIAMIALWRRCIGAFQTPLSGELFLFVGLVVIGPTLMVRHLWRLVASAQNISPVEVGWALCTPTLSLLVILISISVPGTSPLALVLLGVFFLAVEAAVYRPRKRHVSVEATLCTADCGVSEAGVAQLDAVLKGDSDTNPVADTIQRPEPGVSQQMIRCRTEEDFDCLKGWLRVEIPAGHRSQSVHLAFCPAFEQTPTIEVQPEEDASSSRIKVVQCLPYGVHLEVKLSKTSQVDETLTLRFNAVG